MLRNQIIGEGNDVHASVNISRNTEKTYRTMIKGVEVIAAIVSLHNREKLLFRLIVSSEAGTPCGTCIATPRPMTFCQHFY